MRFAKIGDSAGIHQSNQHVEIFLVAQNLELPEVKIGMVVRKTGQ